MLLLTVVYEKSREDIIGQVAEIKEYFQSKDVAFGASESIEGNTHFLKIFCSDEKFDDRLLNMFNIYMANILYNVVIDEFYSKEMDYFLTDTYFFLKNDEVGEIKQKSKIALKSEGAILDENMVYCLNRKNSIMKKIVQCIEENREINIKGFITFRMKELRGDLESIVDKVVENYMVEKEYNEFIKLLKYFVDIQESKIEEVNIIIKNDGTYIIQDDKGKDIFAQMLNELEEIKYTGMVSVEDMLISSLITNSPKNIIIHCADNSVNKELIDTIQNVFLDRVKLCDKCKICESIKHSLKV